MKAVDIIVKTDVEYCQLNTRSLCCVDLNLSSQTAQHFQTVFSYSEVSQNTMNLFLIDKMLLYK